MSIENCSNEIVLTIMSKLDEVSINQLGCCTKNFYSLSQDNHLWKHKLHTNFPFVKKDSFKFEDSLDYYRFYYQLKYNFIILDKSLEDSEFEVPRGVFKYIHQAIEEVGWKTCSDPQTVINHLINNPDCPYDFDFEDDDIDAIKFTSYIKDVISETFSSQTFGSQKKIVVIPKLNNKLNQIEQLERSIEELEKRYREKEESEKRYIIEDGEFFKFKYILSKEYEEYQQMRNRLIKKIEK